MKSFSLICPVEWGGGENQLLLRSVELKKRGVEVHIVCLARSEALEQSLAKSGIKFTCLSNARLGFSPSLIQYIWHAIRLILILILSKKVNLLKEADIINAHGFPSIIIPPLLKLRFRNHLNAKLIYTHHFYPRSNLFLKFKWLFENMLNFYDKLVAVSSKVKEYSLEEVFPKFKGKVVVIPNGIDTAPFSSVRNDKTSLRKLLGLPLNEVLGIYAARFSPQKNHRFLLKCLSHLDGFKLILAGDGTERASFEKEAEALGLKDRIIMTGYIEPELLMQYLCAADVCLFPSKGEGFGVAIIEAMAAGLPTIIFKRIYMEEHGNNILVADSEEEFINLAKKIIYNKEFREELSEKVRVDALKLSIEVTADKYLSLYRELTSHGG